MGLKKDVKRYLRHKVGPKQVEMMGRLTPRSVLLHTQKKAFIDQVRYCAENSPYYKREFERLGIDAAKVESIEDLGALITPNAAVVDTPMEFVCRPPQIAFETTGTKGRNKRIFFTNAEINRATSHITFAFNLYGFTPKDRFVNFYNFNFWVPGVLHQKATEKFEAFCLPAGKVDPEEIYSRLKFYNINVMMGYPSLLMRLTEIADANGRIPMKGIMCSGEHLPNHLREYIEDVWGCGVYRGYGCTESCGGIGAECTHKTGYHIDESEKIIEIINPDKTGLGEIVLTTLKRECMPLLRYKVSDLGRVTTERCECGVPTARIIEIAGRADDKITIGCVDLLPVKCFDELLAGVPDVTEDYQLRAFWEGRREVLELTAETGASDTAEVEKAIWAVIKDKNPDLWKNLSLNMLEFKMKFVAPRSLRGSNVKLNKFTDIRRQQERTM